MFFILGRQFLTQRSVTLICHPGRNCGVGASHGEAARGARPPRTNFKKLESSPVMRMGHELRPYQIEGVNWLLFSWYARRSVMLADEMGLGKTIQSVSTLNHIWRNESIRGPFLVLAPLSTLAHWQREFETWTEMNAIVYHGSHESRELIRQYEFYYADGETNAATRGHYKFHALITSYEVVKTDLSILRHIPWRYMVVDEAHRLKNKDSALTADLRTLTIEHCHLLSGTPLVAIPASGSVRPSGAGAVT